MPRAAIIASFACTLFWGVAGALVAGLEMHPGTLIAVSCLVQSPVQLVISRPGREVRSQTPWRWLVVIGLMGAFLTGAYFVSLRMAPPAIAAAVHLAAPLILLLAAVLRRRRPLGLRTVATAALLAAGVSSGIAGAGFDHVTAAALIGLGLALLSAMAIAVNVTLVNRHGRRGSPPLNSAVAATVCGLPFLPFLVLHPPTLAGAAAVGAITLTCWVPASMLNWWASPKLPPTLSTSIGLNEAVVTGSVAWIALGQTLSPLQIAGGSAILAAVVLEARTHVRHAPATAPPHDRPERKEPRRYERGLVVRTYSRATRPVRVRVRARRLSRA
jgi:drug/metabolite transporter (DMT)-like permease